MRVDEEGERREVEREGLRRREKEERGEIGRKTYK